MSTPFLRGRLELFFFISDVGKEQIMRLNVYPTIENLAVDKREAFSKALSESNIHLIGDIFTGQGHNGSFWGMGYSSFIEKVTGQSLYCDLISPEKVKEMSAFLLANQFTEKDIEYPFITPRSFWGLQKVFSICAKYDLGLKAR
jgi:hypothetical protein